MSKSTWTGAVSSDWNDPDNWSPAGVPSSTSDVTIATGRAVASASIGTVNSITDSSGLRFRSAGTNTVATFVDNNGELRVDRKGGAGGTILNIEGKLTNSGSLRIGNATLSAPDTVSAASLDNTGDIRLLGSSANQALLDVTGSAGFGTAGVLSGNVYLSGDSAIEFKSGEITSLAANAQLHLRGNDAFIEDSTALRKNSALTGLASIGAGALFELENGAAVSTSGALVNDGTIILDANPPDRGGSSLTLAGALTNSGNLSIGNNSTMTASDKVTAAALDNTGSITLTGSSANQALLDVTAGSAGFGAKGVLSGAVILSGDSAIEFASGQITSLAAKAQLSLDGNDAFIEDSTALGSNSALTGLASIGAGAGLELNRGASVSTTGALLNHGTVTVAGGSTLSIGGALTNTGNLSTFAGSALSPSKVSTTALTNTGSIYLAGSFGANQSLLDVTSAAGFGTAGTLTGTVFLFDSAIEFASGQISTIAAGSKLFLDQPDAFIEDSTTLGSNSALTGLTNVAGSLKLFEASVSTTGPLTNNGVLDLDRYSSLSIGGSLTNTGELDFGVEQFSGGSAVSVAGALTNTGLLQIGGASLAYVESVTAKSFVNSGTVDLTSQPGFPDIIATLNVSGATTNNGSISITNDTEELAGAVGGAGSFDLYSNANLQFDSSVSAGQTITEAGMDALTLKHAQDFAATISGFGTKDTIDAVNFLLSATTFKFVENSANTGGTLTLTDSTDSLTANILMTGVYKHSDFSLAQDSGTGTLVKFV
jgi:hypothetical protein